jgi:Family of unknown function (DUF5681)
MTDQNGNGRGERRGDSKKRARAAGDGSDYDVGYGKPPREYQFKPGQSGNPKGAPKRKSELECLRDMRAMFMKAAMVPVTTRVDGKPTKIPALEALYLKVFAKGIAGDGPSMRFAHKLAHESMAEHEEWQAIFYGHAMRLIEELENQPADEKDLEAIRLLDEAMKRVNAKPTDKS